MCCFWRQNNMDECFNSPCSLDLAVIYENITFSTVSCGLSIFAPLTSARLFSSKWARAMGSHQLRSGDSARPRVRGTFQISLAARVSHTRSQEYHPRNQVLLNLVVALLRKIKRSFVL